ncbi:phosphotransferase [Marinobacterium arenosum]|uniref:phosphotransferase n=1 Tax=Marinobacterium arenosum TaxID=2862496 RepID=UPI001C98BEE6|nr:phosphotransferase [Marinobacterium arenosum]MBY4677832.1 phosphotransferase [Marinobacterium arenosum]
MQSTQFSSVNQYLKASPDWQPMACGSSNWLYRAEHQGQTLVLRLNASADVAFGVDRQREARLLEQLAGTDWAPRLVHNDWQQGWCLMAWHGPAPSLPLANRLRQQLLQAVSEWQQLPLQAELELDYRALFEAYRPQLAGLPLEPQLMQLIDRLHGALAALPTVKPVLTHHDLHGANLCVLDQQLVVVDWEYGALGNPWFDAAALQRRFGVSAKQLTQLPAFTTLDSQAMEQGLKRALWLSESLECLWYWARGLGGSDLTMAQLLRRTGQLLQAS